jgi:hypothetical protein
MSELQCKFVSSKGLLKSCVFIPNIQGSTLRNHGFYDTHKRYKDNVISIYVCSSALENFVKDSMNKITYKFVVVTGDSDMEVHVDCFFVKTLLNNPNLIHLYSQNGWGNHDKFTKIPIGIDYHTFIRPHNPPIKQEELLTRIKNSSKPFYERECLCFVNFGGYWGDRIIAHKEIPKDLIYEMKVGTPREIIWKLQTRYSFVISPVGQGLDTHRTWEALILGCIPIIRKNPIVEVFKDLPVLMVNKWSDITKELLETTIKKFKTKKFNYDKLNRSYWGTLFNSHNQ